MSVRADYSVFSARENELLAQFNGFAVESARSREDHSPKKRERFLALLDQLTAELSSSSLRRRDAIEKAQSDLADLGSTSKRQEVNLGDEWGLAASLNPQAIALQFCERYIERYLPTPLQAAGATVVGGVSQVKDARHCLPPNTDVDDELIVRVDAEILEGYLCESLRFGIIAATHMAGRFVDRIEDFMGLQLDEAGFMFSADTDATRRKYQQIIVEYYKESVDTWLGGIKRGRGRPPGTFVVDGEAELHGYTRLVSEGHTTGENGTAIATMLENRRDDILQGADPSGTLWKRITREIDRQRKAQPR